MKLDDAIKAAEQRVQELREALEAVERAAVEEFGVTPPHAILAQKQQAQRVSLTGVRRAVAEARRPKGPTVTLEWSYRGTAPRQVELVRRTATLAIVRSGDGVEERYTVESGNPAGRFNYRLGYWRIREADLAAIRAMPVGENAVSKALKAIEAGRYDEVKPMRSAAVLLAALFIPMAVLAGVHRAEAPQTASLAGAIAGALAALALFLWAVAEAEARRRAGGER